MAIVGKTGLRARLCCKYSVIAAILVMANTSRPNAELYGSPDGGDGGACCLPDGSCQDVLDQADCDALGGAFEGYGTVCRNVTCPVLPGACCLTDGSCQDVADQVACDALGGVFEGHGTTCANTTCPVLPGACCLPDGSCQDVADLAACDALGGVFGGPGSDCATTTCEEPAPQLVPSIYHEAIFLRDTNAIGFGLPGLSLCGPVGAPFLAISSLLMISMRSLRRRRRHDRGST